MLLVLVWLPLLELSSAVGLGFLSTRGVAVKLHPITEAEYREYLGKRDPVLGWPTPVVSQGPLDALGARISPAHPSTSDPACVSTFGDSFTFGDQVDHEHAYPNRLAARLSCRVNNFGIGGYGTDQAFLKFRQKRDGSKVAVLGHYSDDILRNVNRQRDFLGGTQLGMGLKPRFILEQGKLTLLPLPTPANAEAYAALDAKTLPHDYFAPGALGGTVVVRFPHLLGVLSLPFSWRVRSKLALGSESPSYAPFYSPDHDSGALAVTVAIFETFVREARERGQAPVVLLMPDEFDLQALRRGEPLPYQPLIDALKERRIEGPDIASAMKDRDDCATFTHCDQHYSESGYDLVAELVAEWITSHALLVPTP